MNTSHIRKYCSLTPIFRNGDGVWIKNYFTHGNGPKVEQVTFADGTVWGEAGLDNTPIGSAARPPSTKVPFTHYPALASVEATVWKHAA